MNNFSEKKTHILITEFASKNVIVTRVEELSIERILLILGFLGG
jgi:hypothetical protein